MSNKQRNQSAPREQSPGELAKMRGQERHALEAGLLASMIFYAGGKQGQEFLDNVLAVCHGEMFTAIKHREAFNAIRKAHLSGEIVDLVAIGRELKSMPGVSITAADIAAIATNRLEALSRFSAVEQAETIAEEWRKDTASLELHNALRMLQSPTMPCDLANESVKKAQAILDDVVVTEDTSLDACLDEYEQDLANPQQSERPIRMPLQCMNRILRGGIVPGELAILAARPSVGKTALALTIAFSVSCYNHGVVFFSLEMGKKQLLERLISNVGSVDIGKFRTGLDEKERRYVHEAMKRMRGKPLEVIDTPKMTLTEMRRRIRQAKAKHGVKLVVVDYLQLVTPEDLRIPREQQVATMSRELKIMAKEFNIAVLLLAQLNRKGEESNREPILSDLRESGSIEQDADIVMFLHQSRKRTFAVDEPVKLIIAKGRSSGVGSEYIKFLRLYQKFEESSQSDYDKAVRDDNPPHYTEAQGLMLE